MARLAKKTIFTITCASLFVLSSMVFAQSSPIQIDPNLLDRRGGSRPTENIPQANANISERQAVNLARQRYAGNVLRISLVGQGPSMRYQIRMENEGKVFTVFVNATSGRVTRSN